VSLPRFFSERRNTLWKNSICFHANPHAFGVTSILRHCGVLFVRLIPRDLHALHLIVLDQPARNSVYQRAGKACPRAYPCVRFIPETEGQKELDAFQGGRYSLARDRPVRLAWGVEVLLSPKSATHPRDSDKGSRGVSGKGPWSIFTDTPVIQEAFSMRQLLRVRNLRHPFLDIAAHPPGSSTFSEFSPHGSSRFTGPPQLD